MFNPRHLEVRENQPLKPLTTFKIGGPARYFAPIGDAGEIAQAIEFAASRRVPIFVLGGGSNLLISDAGLESLVLHPVSAGISVLAEESGSVSIRVEAGEPWDQVVAAAVEKQWWGMENLSHIPGQAGAALVQNIGAYGQQLSTVFVKAEVAGISSGKILSLPAEECGLGYRRSIFNTSGKGKFCILSLTLRLSLREQPLITYPDVKAWFEEQNIQRPSIAEIRGAIVQIRDRKFPYPRVEKGGNAGSFFKNLTLNLEEYQALERRVREHFGPASGGRLRELRKRLPHNDGIRIPTAFLMELCELKGFRLGGAEVNATQPLVLLNRGGAAARDVLMLARHVRQTVYSRTGVKVEIEPELAGFSRAELETTLSLE